MTTKMTVQQLISDFVENSPLNRFPGDGGKFFDHPLVGFCSATDPLFSEFKRIIGPFHLTPREVLPCSSTVISWVLPIATGTIMSNRRELRWPSREWAVTRDAGEVFNVSLRRYVVAALEEQGYTAVAPQLQPAWRQVDDPSAGIASTWSERHAAYAAGLGTFSLNDSLITARGIAHRLGSVVTDLEIPPTQRPAGDYRDFCLFCRDGSCGACIGRCPVGAISTKGHDKEICRAYVYGAVPREVASRYGVAQTGCGLCQTLVPCEQANPSESRER